MTEPIQSQYDPDPLDPDAEPEKPDDPDLGNTQSPELEVAWDKRPSFNTDPTPIDQDGSGDQEEPTGTAGDFSVNLESVGVQVDNMLATARVLVSRYEALRNKVLSTQGTVFGQTSMNSEDDGYFDFSTGMYWDWDNEPTETVWAEPARQFAENMNPAQHKALQHIGGVLELIGEYIALVNHSGQVYAASDRNSRFPPPPGGVIA